MSKGKRRRRRKPPEQPQATQKQSALRDRRLWIALGGIAGLVAAFFIGRVLLERAPSVAGSDFPPPLPVPSDTGPVLEDFVASEDTGITHVHWWGVLDVTRTEPTLRITRISDIRSGPDDFERN